MSEPMSPREFKNGLKMLAETHYEYRQVWHLTMAYMNADKSAKKDCSEMLRDDLAALEKRKNK